jgi:hypothetical protein
MMIRLRSFIAVTGVAFAADAAAQLSFRQDEHFRGPCFSTQQPIGDLLHYGLNDRAWSAELSTGRWDECALNRFDEHCLVLHRGRYPLPAAIGLTDRLPTAPLAYVEHSAKVSSTCLVAVARNRYSVPCELAGQRVSTRLYPNRVEISSDNILVASHLRLSSRGKISYDWQHYLALAQRKPVVPGNRYTFADMFAPLLRWRQSLYAYIDSAPGPVVAIK